MNFKAVLALPKTHKSISFIWILWSTLYVYLCCIAEAEAEAGVANHPVYASGKADYIVLIVRVKEPFMFYFVSELCRQAHLQLLNLIWTLNAVVCSQKADDVHGVNLKMSLCKSRMKVKRLTRKPSITDGVHRNENLVEIIPVFSTFSNF